MADRFVTRLEELKDRVARLTALVQQSAEVGLDAILSANITLARKVYELDAQIDAEEVLIEKRAIDLLALYQPAASDLRLITVIIKANSDFERIADCAVGAAHRVMPLIRDGYHAPADLRLMANAVLSMLRDTIQAFNLCDETLARQVLRGDDVVDALYHQIVQDMLGRLEGNDGNANTELSNVMIAKSLERMADHCTNIAEDVIYANTGQIVRHLNAV